MAPPAVLTRPTTPASTSPVPFAPTADMCTMCNGQGGSWETTDGSTPGKTISRWVKCVGCNGRGEV